MLKNTFLSLYERDMNALKTQIDSYNDENNLWLIEKSIRNSAGNLCIHLVGNLNHFIGAVLGNTGYVRQREQEFSLRNVPRIELISQIDETKSMIANTLNSLSSDDFQNTYPLEVFGKPMTTEYFLTHLSTHLAYHLGQIDYHRRLLE